MTHGGTVDGLDKPPGHELGVGEDSRWTRHGSRGHSRGCEGIDEFMELAKAEHGRELLVHQIMRGVTAGRCRQLDCLCPFGMAQYSDQPSPLFVVVDG